MLLSTFPSKVLFACPPSPTWNLPSLTVESTLSSPCFHSDLPFFCQDVALAHLDSHLTIWIDGSVPFCFGKGGSGVLVNCCLCGTKVTLSFSAGPVCSSFFAEACAILQTLLISGAPTSLPLFFSSPPNSPVFLPPCPLHLFFCLNLSGRNCVLSSPILSGYNGSPDTRFPLGTMRLMSWPDGECYSCPPAIPSSFSSVISPNHFSRTGGILSYLNSSTHRFPQFPLRQLCFLVTLAVCLFPLFSHTKRL